MDQNKKTDKNFELVIREEASRCLLCHDAPCSKACPAGTDPAKFIRSLRFENPKGAIETIKENNVLGGVCSKVCPSKAYCEGACSRVSLKTPIKIKMLQEYLMELDKTLNVPMLRERKHVDKKVGVVGSGPAGLAVAVELLKEGYDVTVYERDEKLGGYLTYGIPSDRLSGELVAHEINQIKELGVVFKNNAKVEKPEDLLKEGFDAVIWACGLHKGKTLNIDGINLENVEIGVDYLRKVKEEPQNVYVGKNVIVVGGGDVAMDVARTAKLRGADNVNILYRRTENEMPAYIDEKVETKEAGVNMYVKFKPVSIEGNSKVEKATFESLGNDTTITMKCDQYILAISQESEENVDELLDSSKGIFAAGDVVSSEKTVVYAIKSGKEVAKKVIDFVNEKSSVKC
ncbi:MAG: FAD-dependent oxidoreductase [Terrisporobacter othiniensis]|uniref:FAD-dependent oxidoreductase n=1 Tax=Terrisporobacter othiniensis TaxID=1577792 RepID=UPI002A75C89D|nr:FAD-dependent oxidoreductase [Terrisporobacter othiniensis]MDY3374499.1 FAD-dependent oxidoreductase [Terrisporobacter othiniensis]